MSRFVIALACSCLITMCCAGCSKPASKTPAPPSPQVSDKSTAQTAIDGFTGKAALETYKKATKTIEDVNATREAEMQDALGE
ncbi:MAG: hypothetical protein O3A51_05530 [Verrucomicrobia bacterium]|nr:hypothetical protein [Verrucomicrobiota bacterium]